MRTDYDIMRETISGLAVGTRGSPTSDGLAALRPRPPLHCAASDVWSAPDLLGQGQGLRGVGAPPGGEALPGSGDPPRAGGAGGPRAGGASGASGVSGVTAYLYDLRQTFERRSSSTAYASQPLDAVPLMASVRDALAEDRSTWGEDAAVGSLEPFVLLLRPRGAEPGVYRVRLDGVDLVGGLPSPEEIEGMTVQKELTQAGAVVSVAANLDEADAWGGAHGYRHAMARSAAVVYSVHLRSAARGLAGTVFAGFSSSAVRHLLGCDGVSRHQMFAVAVAAPRQEGEP